MGYEVTGSKLEKAILVEATPEQVWKAWTTVEGIRAFFGPDARIELRVKGKYEILFDPDEPEGRKGSEGCEILSFVPEQMLSFSWNAPPQFEKSRLEIAQWVVLNFLPVGDRRTLVNLFEFGWKDSDEGKQVYAYFDRAWTVVLARLAYSFAKGPVDWNDPYRPPA
jgi:uncharacterized protein YndB with AHSA1/START domain